jgi:HSP20 family molecular chaperone IbpA
LLRWENLTTGPLAGKGAFMKSNRNYNDIGQIFDEIFDAARNFGDEFKRNFNDFNFETQFKTCDENVDYYPNYSYPPMNMFMTQDRHLVFEFALAGFDEKNISLTFQGDYMIFSATIVVPPETSENVKFFKRRLKLKDVEKQKYFVPADKYAQEKVKAVFKNGILKITVPPQEDPDLNGGVKIEIIREEN